MKKAQKYAVFDRKGHDNHRHRGVVPHLFHISLFQNDCFLDVLPHLIVSTTSLHRHHKQPKFFSMPTKKGAWSLVYATCRYFKIQVHCPQASPTRAEAWKEENEREHYSCFSTGRHDEAFLRQQNFQVLFSLSTFVLTSPSTNHGSGPVVSRQTRALFLKRKWKFVATAHLMCSSSIRLYNSCFQWMKNLNQSFC